jgi:geranylgeranyl pyrophosphate synthase
MGGMTTQRYGCDDAAFWRKVIDKRLAVISGRFSGQSVLLGDAMAEALLAPGKRFRGTLLLLSGTAAGGVEPSLVDIACGLELAHTASLIFDDLPCMDDAATRRGRLTTHLVHGESRAILAGIALVTESLGLLAGAEGAPGSTRARLVAILAAALGPAGLCAGQDMDLHATKSPDGIVREQDLKTGALFAAGFEMLGAVKNLPPEQTAALVQLGLLFGRVFQSYDDLLDVQHSGEASGKSDGRDNRPSTLPRGLLAVSTLQGAVAHYDDLRTRLEAALADCPFDAAPLARYTATVLPSAAPRAA